METTSLTSCKDFGIQVLAHVKCLGLFLNQSKLEYEISSYFVWAEFSSLLFKFLFDSFKNIKIVNTINFEKGAPKYFQVFIYEYNEASRRWIRVEAVSTVTEAVHDIAFAPNIGRSYHVLVRSQYSGDPKSDHSKSRFIRNPDVFDIRNLNGLD